MVVGLIGHEHIDLDAIDQVVLASVVPPLTPIMIGMVKRYFGRDPLVVDPRTNAGMPILHERPSEVGADRIANSIAAHEQYGRVRGEPLIVADLGTATTFDAITVKGEHWEASFVPGRRLLQTRCSSAPRDSRESTYKAEDGRWTNHGARDRVRSLLRISGNGRGPCAADFGRAGRTPDFDRDRRTGAADCPRDNGLSHRRAGHHASGAADHLGAESTFLRVQISDCRPRTTAGTLKPTCAGRMTVT